jgi:hypothetical protein
MLLVSCNTQLNDEQRRQMKEGRKKMEIRQVPEADLLSRGFMLGEKLAKALPDSFDAQAVTHVTAKHQVKVKWFEPAVLPSEPLLQDLMHAFAYAANQGQTPNSHVQRLGQDSLLYVKPVIRKNHREITFTGMWCIGMPIKKIVLETPAP